jgi:hypothetical protein
MHSNATRAANGSNSVKRACEEANRSFVSEVRNDPKVFATSSGIVIIITPSLRPRAGQKSLSIRYQQPGDRFQSVYVPANSPNQRTTLGQSRSTTPDLRKAELQLPRFSVLSKE